MAASEPEEEEYLCSPSKACSTQKLKCIATDDDLWKYNQMMSTFSFVDENGNLQLVGQKKHLNFNEKSGAIAEQETNWVMEEFSIPSAEKLRKVI